MRVMNVEGVGFRSTIAKSRDFPAAFLASISVHFAPKIFAKIRGVSLGSRKGTTVYADILLLKTQGKSKKEKAKEKDLLGCSNENPWGRDSEGSCSLDSPEERPVTFL